MLDVDVEYELSWAKYHQVNFPLYFSTVHKTTNNLKFQISFCHYQAHNNFTAQQSHYNELPEAIKGSFCGETFINTRKTAFLQPVITEHSSRGVTLAFVVCQKSFQEASVRSSNQHASAWQKLMGLNWYGTPLLPSHFKSQPRPTLISFGHVLVAHIV